MKNTESQSSVAVETPIYDLRNTHLYIEPTALSSRHAAALLGRIALHLNDTDLKITVVADREKELPCADIIIRMVQQCDRVRFLYLTKGQPMAQALVNAARKEQKKSGRNIGILFGRMRAALTIAERCSDGRLKPSYYTAEEEGRLQDVTAEVNTRYDEKQKSRFVPIELDIHSVPENPIPERDGFFRETDEEEVCTACMNFETHRKEMNREAVEKRMNAFTHALTRRTVDLPEDIVLNLPIIAVLLRRLEESSAYAEMRSDIPLWQASESSEMLSAYLRGFTGRVAEVLRRCNSEQLIRQSLSYSCATEQLRSFAKEGVFFDSGTRFGDDYFTPEEFAELMHKLLRDRMSRHSLKQGGYFSSDSISRLMARLLVSGGVTGDSVDICDMAVGSSTMLNSLRDAIPAEVKTGMYGADKAQEPLADAELMQFLRGNDASIVDADILTRDPFPDRTFRYIICEPPMGMKCPELMRPIPGMPEVRDSALYFLTYGLSKLNDEGRMAILQPGSSLFSLRQGADAVRRYILENDLAEAIVDLGPGHGIGTGISLYVWILNRRKASERKGRILLINASTCGTETPRRGIILNMRRTLSREDEKLLEQAFEAFEDNGFYGDAAGSHCETRVLANDAPGHFEAKVSGQGADSTIFVSKPDTPAAYFAREILPQDPTAQLLEDSVREFWDIPLARYFYTVPEGETLEVSLEKNIRTLRLRVEELREERDIRMQQLNARINEAASKLSELERIMQQVPSLRRVQLLSPRLRGMRIIH